MYTHLAIYYHSCLEPSHRTYLNKRGITDATIQTFQIGYVPESKHTLYTKDFSSDSGLVKQNGKPFLAKRIVFPYLVDDVVTDFRGRSFDPNEEQRYSTPYGGTFFRGADYGYNQQAITHDPVVITEGEVKALASWQCGIPTLAIPGILAVRPQVRTRYGQRVIVCFDNQVENWYDVIRAIQRLATVFDTLHVATLPLCGFEKMDIDTYVLHAGCDAYRRVLDRAVPYQRWLAMVRP
jgi:DNA primase